MKGPFAIYDGEEEGVILGRGGEGIFPKYYRVKVI